MTILKNIGLSKRYGKAIIYFYLNLGISRKEYYFIPFVVEFIGFILFITLIAYLGNAIR